MEKIDQRKRKLASILFTYEEVSEEVLRLLLGDKSRARFILKAMFREEVIKKSKQNVKDENKKKLYATTSVYLTTQGKRLVCGEDAEVPSRKDSVKNLERTKKVSDSILMCCVAGCVGLRKTGYPEYYRLYDPETGYLHINPFALGEAKQEINGIEIMESDFQLDALIPLKDKYGVVIPMKEIREFYKLSKDDVNHYNFSSSTGVLLGKYSPYFLYHANEGYLSTSKGGENSLMKQITLHLFRQGVYTMGKNDLFNIANGIPFHKAILFVNNKVDFRRFIKNHYNLNYAAFEQYKEAIVIPTNSDGANFLKLQIMNNGFKDTTINAFCKSGYTLRNEKIDNFAFPLLDKSGKKVYYGINMDINSLTYMYKYVQDNDGEIDFKILCLKWQKGYYQSLLGQEITCVTIDEGKVAKYIDPAQSI